MVLPKKNESEESEANKELKLKNQFRLGVNVDVSKMQKLIKRGSVTMLTPLSVQLEASEEEQFAATPTPLDLKDGAALKEKRSKLPIP